MRTKAFGLMAASLFLISTLSMFGQGRGGANVQLPEGNGRDLVTKTCSTCHGLDMITQGWGYDTKGWSDLIASMVKLPDADRSTIATYLGAHFGAKTRPATVVVPGAVSVEIKEWLVPTLGSRPHDPLPAADGSLWWTGQWADVLGRLDPKTGMMKEYPLPMGSRPHGLTQDKAGNIWYTGNGNGTVGKLDPKTGDVKVYKMPDPAARDPHTPLFDPKGNLWFSLQQSNMAGRLNPQTGDIKLVTLPTPQSLPYGMVMTSKGVPVICLFGTNKIASFDPDTMAIKEYTLPNAAARPRRIAITSDDLIWYADYARGYLGRLNLSNGEVKEWASPSGPQSQPYGIIADHKNIIWYNESAVRPNTIVRFDPKTEKFQSWIIPSGGGVVRNMGVNKDGDLYLANSGVNRVAIVDVK
jgi:virginiamycin B lyase